MNQVWLTQLNWTRNSNLIYIHHLDLAKSKHIIYINNN